MNKRCRIARSGVSRERESDMKEELLKIAQESLSSDEVEAIVKQGFMKALQNAVDDAFKLGDAKNAIEKKVK